MTVIKPYKPAFLIWPWIASSIVWLIIYGIAAAVMTFALEQPGIYIFVLYPFHRALSYWLDSKRYEKASYEFLEQRILTKGGSLFSDYTTELQINKITTVSIILPWLEHKLFGTGHVAIQSAGSGGVEAHLTHVKDPESYENKIKELMQQNGFRLQQKELLQEEQPDPVGILLQIGGGAFVSILVFLSFLGPSAIGMLAAGLWFIIPIVVIIAVGAIIGFIFHYLDLRNRTYQVYDDTIRYYEGFLTKTTSFIPAENLSDAEATQGFLSRLLGLYDVKISCQGANSHVTFLNMKHGDKLRQSIDSITDTSLSKAPKNDTKATKIEKEARKQPVFSQDIATFKMNTGRTIFAAIIGVILAALFLPIGLLFLPLLSISIMLFFGAIIAAVQSFIAISATTYELTKNGVASEYSFLQKNRQDFSSEKLTGIEITQGILDRFFDTVTVSFWSIGSSKNVVFKNVKRTQALMKGVFGKAGIYASEEVLSLRPKISLFIFFLRASPLFILATIATVFFPVYGGIALGCIALLTMVVLIYKLALFKNAYITVSGDSVHHHYGLLRIKDTYALYDNIKNIRTTSYPISGKGRLALDVAGESVVQTGNNQTLRNNTISMEYIPGIANLDELLDIILNNRPGAKKAKEIMANIEKYHQDAVMTAKPSLMQALMLPVISLVIGAGAVYITTVNGTIGNTFLPTFAKYYIPFAVLIILYTIIATKRISYAVEPERILRESGILFRTQKSIVFAKVDHFNTDQGMINKMFGTGNILIHTTGSSATGTAELAITNIPDYKAFANEIEQRYK